jgi:hypothetical protein
MAKRKKIPVSTKRRLLARARGGCFAHRISWYGRVDTDDDASKKALPLDIHHVQFVSAGGGNAEENLVPVCPLCHRFIHDTKKLGRVDATPESIRAAWELWLSFGTLPLGRRIGVADPAIEVTVALPTYALNPRFVIGADVNYQEVRDTIVEAVVLSLAAADPHFAFPDPRGAAGPSLWFLSSDGRSPAAQWNTISAHVVMNQIHAPITLKAPCIIALTQKRHPILEGNEEQRTL